MDSRVVQSCMGFIRCLVLAAALPGIANAQTSAAAVSEARAQEIAREAAGCKTVEDCVLRGGWRDGKWIFVVSFVAGRDPAGNPLFAPGGFIGITVGRDGQILDRMPGS